MMQDQIRFFVATAIAILTALVSGLPQAQASNRGQKSFPDNNVCSALIAKYERKEGIPARLLYAISIAESGRYDARRRAIVAWPWAVNAAGDSAYHATKAQAIAAVRRLRRRGARNVDVGCMQVNLMHHPKAFPNLQAAFDPARNVAYAARFLKRLHATTGSWIHAVAAYHSQIARQGHPYMLRVLKIWVDHRPKSAGTYIARAQPARRQPGSKAATARPAVPAVNVALAKKRPATRPAARPKPRVTQLAVRTTPSRSSSLVHRARASTTTTAKRKWAEVLARRKKFAQWLARRQAARRAGRNPG